MTPLGDRKREIRSRVLAQRQAQPAGALVQAQASFEPLLWQLLDLRAPRVVFTYLATHGEVGTGATIDALRQRGISVLVPRLLDGTRMIAVDFPGWAELVPGRLGILTPVSTTPSAQRADLVIVPGLAFTTLGARLGFGAGYYDRWLAEHHHATRVGVCFEFQLRACLPVDSHDQNVEYLVTERRIVACGQFLRN